MYEHALTSQVTQACNELELRADILDDHIDHYRRLLTVLALDQQLKAALENPPQSNSLSVANKLLEQLNTLNQTRSLTLIDRNRLAAAASNWREAKSTVGHLYAPSLPVVEAMRRGQSGPYALGNTNKTSEYVLARAILDQSGEAIGAVAMEVDLDSSESEWTITSKVLLLTDNRDIIFFTNRPALHQLTQASLSTKKQNNLQNAYVYREYGANEAELRVHREFGCSARVIDVTEPVYESSLLLTSVKVQREGWALYSMESTGRSVEQVWLVAASAVGAWILLAVFVIVFWKRYRIAQPKIRAEFEFEQLVEHHMRVVREARDGVIEAARKAALGFEGGLDHLPQGVCVIDRNLNLVAWNRRYVELFRYPPDLLHTGRSISDLIAHTAARGILRTANHELAIRRRLDLIRVGQSHLYERISLDGRVIEVRGDPLPDGGFVSSFVDITAYRRAARKLRSMGRELEARVRQLQIASNRAEEANHARTHIIAAAAHDLMQPLNAARLYSSILRRHVRADCQELAQHLDTALCTQNGILSSLLDISRLESSAFKVNLTEFPLSSLFASLQTQFSPHVTPRDLRFDIVMTHAIVVSDAVLLHRIVQNFVSNAFKFTPPNGRVLLGARRVEGRVRIEVWDTGPGIQKSQQEKIFEEFHRILGSDMRGNSTEGAGLGLAIVRHIARALHHPVVVRSRLGLGSVFSVEVPLRQNRNDPAPGDSSV